MTTELQKREHPINYIAVHAAMTGEETQEVRYRKFTIDSSFDCHSRSALY
jgi:hypothetical protein